MSPERSKARRRGGFPLYACAPKYPLRSARKDLRRVQSILRKETARYKQAFDDSSWLEERTAQIKSLVEASALRERDRIIQIVVDALGEALRAQHGFPAENPVVKALSEKIPTDDLLRRLDALESLRSRLGLGVQEPLALESGFLEMITNNRSNAQRSTFKS